MLTKPEIDVKKAQMIAFLAYHFGHRWVFRVPWNGIIDTLKSFCLLWALGGAPNHVVPGLNLNAQVEVDWTVSLIKKLTSESCFFETLNRDF